MPRCVPLTAGRPVPVRKCLAPPIRPPAAVSLMKATCPQRNDAKKGTGPAIPRRPGPIVRLRPCAAVVQRLELLTGSAAATRAGTPTRLTLHRLVGDLRASAAAARAGLRAAALALGAALAIRAALAGPRGADRSPHLRDRRLTRAARASRRRIPRTVRTGPQRHHQQK
jgi:hypothetical protein